MSDEMEKQLAVLREKYLASLPSKVNGIRSLWVNILKDKDLLGVDDMHRMAHSISGSGATFGATQVSQSAKSLENYIKACISDECVFEAENISQIETLLSDLEGFVSEG